MRGISRSRLRAELFFLFSIFTLPISDTATTYSLQPGNTITTNQTLVSPSGSFTLGFFRPGITDYFLGIWYSNIPNKTVIWVANRDQPLADSKAVLSISENGNIVLKNSLGEPIWSTGISSLKNDTTGILLDSGNFVLRGEGGKNLWESFNNPADSFIPEMTIKDQRMVAWKSKEDPSPGEFSTGLSSLEIVTWRNKEIYWSNGAMVGSFGFWALKEGNSTIPFVLSISRVKENISITLGSIAGSPPVRWTLEPTGDLKLMVWNKTEKRWEEKESAPNSFCDVYRGCGTWGACDIFGEPPTCGCLKGFVPKNRTRWEKGDFSGGCTREAPLLFRKDDEFLLVEDTKLPGGFALLDSKTEEGCKGECMLRSNCTAFAFSNATAEPEDFVCLVWLDDVSDLQAPNNGGANLYIRMVATKKDHVKRRKKVLPPLLYSFGALTAGICFLLVFFRLKSIGERRARERMMSEDGHNPGAFKRVEEISDAPFVSFRAIKRATCDFSDASKLGEGGFGSVYKGKLMSGEEVAVKRLSKASKQGQIEFINEVKLIAKLQHKNLVRLLGWCIHKEERILIYEYLPNRSLDKLIFDKPEELGWERRFSIVEGIADGLLYLHHHSRMRVIHRDLKTSNILLDSEMNPKISDFGLAKIIEMGQKQGNTTKLAGTLGFMSPEYAQDGIYSEKSDVYAFGIILLEVISGKRCTGYYHFMDSKSMLLGNAWKLWNEGQTVELFEPKVPISNHEQKGLKLLHVALLCTEQYADDRPTMNSVVSILATENYALPPPRQPGLPLRRELSLELLSSPRTSVNGLTITTLEPC